MGSEATGFYTPKPRHWSNNVQADNGSITSAVPISLLLAIITQTYIDSKQRKLHKRSDVKLLLVPNYLLCCCQVQVRTFFTPTDVLAVTHKTSSILAIICSAHALSFSTAFRSRTLSASSLVSSPSARVNPILRFCLKNRERKAWVKIADWPVTRKSNLLTFRMSNRFHYWLLYENGEVTTFLHNICTHCET